MRPHRLPRCHRLHKRADFQKTYSLGTKLVYGAFVLFARLNGSSMSRLGVTATRRIGGSVVRNRARRLIREAYRLSADQLPPGFDFVVVARSPLLQLDVKQLQPVLVEAASLAESKLAQQ